MTDFLQWLHLCKLLISMFLLANCFAKIHLCIEKTKVINDNRSKLKTKKTMDKITKINSGEKFTHTSVGKLAEFNGKQFLKDTVGTTGCEISFGTIEPGQAAPFFHSHKQNEEIYSQWRRRLSSKRYGFPHCRGIDCPCSHSLQSFHTMHINRKNALHLHSGKRR